MGFFASIYMTEEYCEITCAIKNACNMQYKDYTIQQQCTCFTFDVSEQKPINGFPQLFSTLLKSVHEAAVLAQFQSISSFIPDH